MEHGFSIEVGAEEVAVVVGSSALREGGEG